MSLEMLEYGSYPLPDQSARIGWALGQVAVGQSVRTAAAKTRVLRCALAQSGAPESGPALAFPAGAAPTLGDSWVLSLAHSGRVLLGAAVPAVDGAGRCALGVDIEVNRPREFGRLESFLGWPNRSQDMAHFYRRWTLAEALLKALGRVQARALFNALDCALESSDGNGRLRTIDLMEHRFHVVWPATDGTQTQCWLLRQQP